MPKLFLIRHAIAEDRDTFKKTGQSDDQRPLTDFGKKKMQKIAKKLLSLEPDIPLFCQSPLTRSQQTVDVLKKFYLKSKTQTLKSLSPGSSHTDLLEDLKNNPLQNTALVGHENHISQLLGFLLTGEPQSRAFLFKKGGIACLEFHKIQAGQFKLLWIVSPKVFLS